MTGRYAIYFAPPPGSDLEAFGRRFVGRDHLTGERIEQPEIEGLDGAYLTDITRSARHYGFHATLKAPFALRDGRTERELVDALETFAAEQKPFDAPPLQISALSRWLAFTLSAGSPDMARLAADCVRHFEPFRAPLRDEDIARRRQSGLTPRQDEQLLAFGYPYIFDDFHFHMTLAGPLGQREKTKVLETIKREAVGLTNGSLRVDAIALYQQPDRESPFIQTARFPFQPA